jgi:hypothetical protein
MDNGDPRFPYPRFLGVDFVFVPHGNPLPLEWMAAHPNYVTISAVFIPDPPSELNMGLGPQTGVEAQLELLQDVGTYEVVIDYAGNWTIRPVEPLTPQPAPRIEPPSAQPQEARPPGPILDPQPKEPRPDYLRCVPPPGPRRARGGPPPLGPNPAARGMDPLAPEFAPTLVRKTARIMAGMDRVMRPGGIATDEGLSAAVRAGMQHLDAHKGDVRAALAAAKSGEPTRDSPVPTPPPLHQPEETGEPAVTDDPAGQPVWHFVRPRRSGAVSKPAPSSADVDNGPTPFAGEDAIETLGAMLLGAGVALAATGIGAPEGLVLAGEGGSVLAGAAIADPAAVGAGTATAAAGTVLMNQSQGESGGGGLREAIEREIQESQFTGGKIVGDIGKPHAVSNPDPTLGPDQVRYQVLFSHEFGKATPYSVNYDPATGRFGIIKIASGR